ncbi:LexA/Signal peptidase [Sodiomyces alkalinus F11]|uniref:LexA/Signal peptidase n=1 Tax=Sodiomyces alkalinus (strain CBS 110278 / VKM F-3762 / F11) TaxID=1314773 RepID=A0A3N2PWL6_SODAK|nr:LexA/Signal peptidase [Sodiomyces alkalinus F11]ROT38898.1 LexA/Signal peptidase [Sodiomyces alkalinus F11]
MARGRLFNATFGWARTYFQRHRGTASAPLFVSLGTLKAIVACHLLWEHGISFGGAAGSSMLPTFSVYGDYLLVSKYYRRGRDLHVGDLVFYDIPIFRRAQGVKRIMGLPGDYVLHGDPDTGSQVMIQVPQGHCWITGDNLESSRDSRVFGPLPLALVRGKVLAKIWPPQEAHWIRNGLEDSKSSENDSVALSS